MQRVQTLAYSSTSSAGGDHHAGTVIASVLAV